MFTWLCPSGVGASIWRRCLTVHHVSERLSWGRGLQSALAQLCSFLHCLTDREPKRRLRHVIPADWRETCYVKHDRKK